MLLGHRPGSHDHLRDNRFIVIDEIVEAPDVFYRHDEEMDGSVGTDVSEYH